MSFLFLSFIFISNIMNIKWTLESWRLTSVFSWLNCSFSRFFSFSPVLVVCCVVVQRFIKNQFGTCFFLFIAHIKTNAFASIAIAIAFASFSHFTICNRFQFLCFIISYYCCSSRYQILLGSNPIMCVVFCSLSYFISISLTLLQIQHAGNEMKWKMKKIEMKCRKKNGRKPGNIYTSIAIARKYPHISLKQYVAVKCGVRFVRVFMDGYSKALR